MRQAIRPLLAGCGLLVLSACQLIRSPAIETGLTSLNQDSRVQFVVLHYTHDDDQTSLRQLTSTKSQVSAHYLLSRTPLSHPVLYRLVPEEQRAWHAGRSQWQEHSALNASSIGIEIVNTGYPANEADIPLMQRHWQDFTPAQLSSLASLLSQLTQRYQIPPDRLLGHSDIAPGRKVDPGPRFPWKQLHDEYGLGAWPDEIRVHQLLASHWHAPTLSQLQQMLAEYGYAQPLTGQLDQPTIAVLTAFQLHFRPARYDGQPDRETAARLQVLLEQYRRPDSALEH